jgi:methionyl-tRNA formyltransferase
VGVQKICLAGDGWGALAAFAALKRGFACVQVVTADEDLVACLRPNDERLSALADADADLVVCAGYKPIIPVEFLRKRQHLNVHYSLLPKYRGMHSTVWAILNGEKYCGCTVHLMNEFIDDGPIVAQFCTVTEGKTAAEIMHACNDWVRENLDVVVSDFIAGKINPVAQDKSQATWVPRRNLDDCYIDFNESSVYLERMLRALVPPYPLPRFRYKGVVYEVARARVIHRPYICTNGRIVNIDDEGVWIKVGDGLLLVSEVLCDGKPVPWSFFRIGARLG